MKKVEVVEGLKMIMACESEARWEEDGGDTNKKAGEVLAWREERKRRDGGRGRAVGSEGGVQR